MSLSNVDIPNTTSFLAVDSRTDSKVLFLPSASTIMGRLITLKDYYGTANVNPFTISTVGLDRIDIYSSSILISTSFQAISLLSYETTGWSILTTEGSPLPDSTPSPAYDTTVFDNNATIFSVNTTTSAKSIVLPAISTIPGQTIIIKDTEGSTDKNDSTILVSTSGNNQFEYSTTNIFVMSQAYGCWTFMNDGVSSWFLTETYLNNADIQT
jgi:hypothetical protein